MNNWAAGNIRIYRTPTQWFSSDPPQEWGQLSSREMQRLGSILYHGIPEEAITQAISIDAARRMEELSQRMISGLLDIDSLEILESQIPTLMRPPEMFGSPTPVSQPQPQPLPQHVAALVIRSAIESGAQCPITMESIAESNAAVTSCGHVFNRRALDRWLETNTTCPECRQICCRG